jgi:hypothetical protein
MLRSFQDLVKVLTLFPSKYAALYVPRKTIGNDYDKLFDVIRTGNHQTEEAVADDLYGAHDAKTLTRYFTTKSRLKDRIESGFFFLDMQSLPHHKAREYALWKDVVIVHVLAFAGVRETAFLRWEKLAEESETLGLTDICVMAHEHLRNSSAAAGSMVLLKKHHALAEAALERKSAELKLTSAIAELDVFKVRETFLPASLLERCIEIEREATKIRAKYDSPGIRLMYFKAQQYRAEAQQDYAEAVRILSVCEQELLAAFSYDVRFLIAQQKLPYFLLLRDAHALQTALKLALSNSHAEMPEILTVYEYALLTAIHARDWVMALELWTNALSTPAFTRFVSGDVGVRWRLYEVYLRFLLREQCPPRPTLFKPRFAPTKVIGDFLQTASTLAKGDSEPVQTALYIAQLLMAASEQKTEEMQVIAMTLEKFQEKYLRKDTPNYRLQCFLRLVQVAAEANFDVDETLRKTRKHVDWLSAARVFDIIALETLEILPYDHAWILLLHTMKHQHESKQSSFTEVLRLAQKPQYFYD